MTRARILADYVSSGVTAAEFDFLDTTSGTPGSGNFLRGDKTWAEAGGGVDGITSSADANAINIDSSERVIMKAQPMMLATGDAGSNQDLATAHADITILSATTTDCFIRGITLSSGVAEVPIAGKYFISLQTQVSSISDGDTIFINLAFSAHQDRNSILRDSNTSAHVSITGIFDMNASETVTAQISNGMALRGTLLNSKDSLRMSILYIGE